MLSPELVTQILESAPDAIVIVDSAGTVVFASRQITTLLGYAPQEITGSPVENILPERFRRAHLAHRDSYAPNPSFRPMGVGLDLRALRKDGSELVVEISLSPILDGERQLVAAAIRDATDRKHVERQLNEAREAAERANRAKSRFLATASHDLRQPLQTLSFLNGTLRRVVSEPMASEAVAQQGQAIEAMSRLTNALLDISKLESGAVRPDPADFEVAALLEEMRGEFATLAAEKRLDLRIDAASGNRAHSDRSLVGQILRNLLANAIKYTHEGWVALRCAPTTAGLYLEVADSGVGIPTDQLPYIYDEFFQVGVASNTSRDGYGLGLSIVQRLVRLLDLKLEVRSEVGRGSTFALELPAARASHASSAQAIASKSSAAARPTTARVLLLDDDEGVRNATAMLLRIEGFEVLLAASLAEAIEAARQASGLDLVIADYHLQRGETGIQAIEAVRSLRGEHIGAVLVSGDTSSTLREVRADERLRIASKPIQAEELLAIVSSLLQSAPGERDASATHAVSD